MFDIITVSGDITNDLAKKKQGKIKESYSF
jgi:hypothetical protein